MNSRAFIPTALILMMTTFGYAQDTPGAGQAAPFTIRVSVEEVLLHATVQTKKRTPVAGLGQENFRIFEDGTLQQIKHFSHQDVPVTVGIVIDNSGSMRPKRAEVIAAALAFAGSSNPLDEMFLVNFNEHVRFGLPANTPFTDKPEVLKAAMNSVIADGETALYDAVAVALEHLKKGTRDKKVLVVISDGGDNASRHTKEQVQAMATQSDAIIYTIGIYEPDDPDNKNPHALRQLAKVTGGEAFFPESLREVAPVCERIARDIRNQYAISYVSTNQKQDGTYRTIQVDATSPHGGRLVVTTRAGYVAPSQSAATASSQARN
jgi:Ca-activated chloride channel homolog